MEENIPSVITYVLTIVSLLIGMKTLIVAPMKEEVIKSDNNNKVRLQSLEGHLNTKIEDIKTDVSQLRLDVKDVKNEAFKSIKDTKQDLLNAVRDNDSKMTKRVDDLTDRVLHLEKIYTPRA